MKKNLKSKNGMTLIGLVITIIIVLMIMSAGCVLFYKNSNKNNNDNLNNNGTNNNKIIYKDVTRNLKNSYTFDETVSKFAFEITNENNKSKNFIFSSNSVYSLDDYHLNSKDLKYNGPTLSYKEIDGTLLKNIITEIDIDYSNVHDYYKKIVTSENVSDINMYNNSEDYYFSCISNNGDINYIYIKELDENIISTIISYDKYQIKYNKIDKTSSEILEILKGAANCYSVDDGEEPFIEDKIINIPLALNRKIPNANLVRYVINDDTGSTFSFGKEIYLDVLDDKFKNEKFKIGTFHIDYTGNYKFSNYYETISNNPEVKHWQNTDSSLNKFLINNNGLIQMITIQKYDFESKNFVKIDKYSDFIEIIDTVLIKN